MGPILVEGDEEEAFKPYAMEIGLLTRDWNELQGQMCGLFWLFLDASPLPFSREFPESIYCDVSEAVWHAIPNDRFQRRMLEYAAEYRLHQKSKLLEDIKWLIEKANNTGNQRDDAMHSPLIAVVWDRHFRYFSDTQHGHPRAINLKDKDVLAEIAYYRDRCRVLASYARSLSRYLGKIPIAAWRNDSQLPPLPEKPVLPHAPPKMQDEG